jgi:hypothetical protein
MLETPLIGRYEREGLRLAFRVPLPYLIFVRVVAITGAVFFLNAWVQLLPGFYPAWWFLVGSLLLFAAMLAGLSLNQVVFQFRERTYSRRQGPGILPKTTRGSLNALDAVVLIAEPRGHRVTYHLLLHWKNAVEPSMLLLQQSNNLGPGQPLGLAAEPIRTTGIQWAQSLGVMFYDNSHFASPNPFGKVFPGS